MRHAALTGGCSGSHLRATYCSVSDTDELVLESLDAVPEPLRALFREEGGVGFRYQPPEDPAPYKRKSAELLGEKKREQQKREEAERRLTDTLAKLTDGDDPLDLDEVLDIYRKAKAQPPPSGGQPDAAAQAEAARERKRALEALEAKKNAELSERDRQIATLTEQLNVNVCEGGLRRYCDNPKLPFKLQEGAVETLVKIARAEKPFTVTDGKWTMRDDVLDDDGAPIETTEAWVAHQVTKQPFLLVPSSGGGAGAAGAAGAPVGLRVKKFEDMSEAERAQLSREDPEAHKKAVLASIERQKKQRAAA